MKKNVRMYPIRRLQVVKYVNFIFFQALTPMEVSQNREGSVQEANGKPPSNLH